MRIKGINFPEELLGAQEEGKLVIFAGAGVSQGEPSALPNFDDLADQCAEDTVLKRQKEKDEPVDRFLGRLHHNGVDVHGICRDILSRPDSKPTSLHRNLLGLFTPGDKVRLVTTNSDRHFTTAARELASGNFGKAEVFRAPALPLGHNFNGIVYLHGCVDQDPERMVLTDENFGRAYLTEGWARIFLQNLFREFTVLFVGYSHEDTIMNYLARGLPPTSNRKRYALASDLSDEHWKYLGIESIIYPKGEEPEKHRALDEGIAGWIYFTKEKYLDREARVRRIVASLPSADPEDNDYIERALTKPATCLFFTRHARLPEWLEWVEKMGLLNLLFKPGGELGEIDWMLGQWFAKAFVIQHLEKSLELILRKGSVLHPWLAKEVGLHIWREEELPDPGQLSKLLAVLVGSPLRSTMPLDYLLDKLRVPDDTPSLFLLFEHLTRPHLKLEKNFRMSAEGTFDSNGTNVELEIGSTEGDHWLRRAWGTKIKPNFNLYANRLIVMLIGINL